MFVKNLNPGIKRGKIMGEKNLWWFFYRVIKIFGVFPEKTQLVKVLTQ